MQVYRDGGLTLDQLMAFAVSEDHARQEQVHDDLSCNNEPHIIRRTMTETNVRANDRRAVFIGADAYAAGGNFRIRSCRRRWRWWASGVADAFPAGAGW
jgi:ParB family chromosome partitioning protein